MRHTPAAERKMGFSALKLYAIGITLAFGYVYFYSVDPIKIAMNNAVSIVNNGDRITLEGLAAQIYKYPEDLRYPIPEDEKEELEKMHAEAIASTNRWRNEFIKSHQEDFSFDLADYERDKKAFFDYSEWLQNNGASLSQPERKEASKQLKKLGSQYNSYDFFLMRWLVNNKEYKGVIISGSNKAKPLPDGVLFTIKTTPEEAKIIEESFKD